MAKKFLTPIDMSGNQIVNFRVENLGSLPAFGSAGRLVSVSGVTYEDTGSAWKKIGITNWDDVENKPASFPPATHSHDEASGTAAGLMPLAAFVKLAAIETGATGDQSGSEIKTAYEGELDTNAFSDAEKSKLAAIDAAHYGDPVQDTVALAAIPEASATDKERRYVEDDTSDYFYDVSAVSGDVAPTDQTGGAGFWRRVTVSGETAASIKTKYESNADTNGYTNAEKSKLAAIATGAEVNVKSDWNQSSTSADDFIANKPTLIQKFAADCPSAAGTTAVVAHALGTTDVVVQVYDNTTDEMILCDVDITDLNTVTLSFGASQLQNAFRCVVVG